MGTQSKLFKKCDGCFQALSEYIYTDALKFQIRKVIFNGTATIVIWKDGIKTVVKCGEKDKYDPEKGLAMCFAKRALGNRGKYYEKFKEFIPDDWDSWIDPDEFLSKEEENEV